MSSTLQEAICDSTGINFLGLDGHPLPGLKVRLVVEGRVHFHTTDARGCIPPLPTEPGTPLRVDVNPLDDNAPSVDTDHVPLGNSVWTLARPSMVLVVNA